MEVSKLWVETDLDNSDVDSAAQHLIAMVHVRSASVFELRTQM
jgi:hypothetical protein